MRHPQNVGLDSSTIQI